jgi:hypothetical protein
VIMERALCRKEVVSVSQPENIPLSSKILITLIPCLFLAEFVCSLSLVVVVVVSVVVVVRLDRLSFWILAGRPGVNF